MRPKSVWPALPTGSPSCERPTSWRTGPRSSPRRRPVACQPSSVRTGPSHGRDPRRRAVAARALLEGPPTGQREILAVLGPRDHSPRDLAARLARLIGKPVDRGSRASRGGGSGLHRDGSLRRLRRAGSPPLPEHQRRPGASSTEGARVVRGTGSRPTPSSQRSSVCRRRDPAAEGPLSGMGPSTPCERPDRKPRTVPTEISGPADLTGREIADAAPTRCTGLRAPGSRTAERRSRREPRDGRGRGPGDRRRRRPGLGQQPRLSGAKQRSLHRGDRNSHVQVRRPGAADPAPAALPGDPPRAAKSRPRELQGPGRGRIRDLPPAGPCPSRCSPGMARPSRRNRWPAACPNAPW